jgi:hypothetical protein
MKTKKQAVTTRQTARPRTNPREKLWDPIEEVVYEHLFDELFETAFDCEVPGVGDGGPGELQVPMERIAERLTRRFLDDAQGLFKKLLVEAATLARTRESIQRAGHERKSAKK